MGPRPHTYALCIALLFAVAQPASADQTAQAEPMPVVPAALEQGPLDILPTLKGHMARLGSLMNVLFRNIDDPARADELIGIADEMKEHLDRSKNFTPLSILLIGEPKQYAAAEAAYLKCLSDTTAMISDLKTALRDGNAGTPRAALLRLDQKRRDCHVAFG